MPTPELDLLRITDVMLDEVGKLAHGHGARRFRSMVSSDLCRFLTVLGKHSE